MKRRGGSRDLTRMEDLTETMEAIEKPRMRISVVRLINGRGEADSAAIREAIDITTDNICGLLIYCFSKCPSERRVLSVREKSVVDKEIRAR